MGQTGGEWGCGETLRDARHLALVRERQRTGTDNRRSFGRRQVLRPDADAPPQLLIGKRCGVEMIRRLRTPALLGEARRKHQADNGECSGSECYGSSHARLLHAGPRRHRLERLRRAVPHENK